jgi:hypothetical protein
VQIPTVQSFLSGSEAVDYHNAEVAPHIMKQFYDKAQQAFKFYSIKPLEYLNSFSLYPF